MKFYQELKSRLETCKLINYKIFTQVRGGLALLDSEKAEVLATQSWGSGSASKRPVGAYSIWDGWRGDVRIQVYSYKWSEVSHPADVEATMTGVKVGKALTPER